MITRDEHSPPPAATTGATAVPALDNHRNPSLTAPRSAAAPPRIEYRDHTGGEHETALSAVDRDTIRQMAMWRTFTWRRGQKHFPGIYYSTTMHAHVEHESQHELARLILADWAPDVEFIASQPFGLRYTDDGRSRRHTPDFALLGTDGSIRIVNVKTATAMTSEKTRLKLEAVEAVFHDNGWAHEIWTGEDTVRMDNIRYLAGFRRSGLFDPNLIAHVIHTAAGHTIAEVTDDLAAIYGRHRVLPAVMHALWTHDLHTDLTISLSHASILRTTR